jgi:hypothetical protein
MSSDIQAVCPASLQKILGLNSSSLSPMVMQSQIASLGASQAQPAFFSFSSSQTSNPVKKTFQNYFQEFINKPVVKKTSQFLEMQLAFLNEFVAWFDHSGLSKKVFGRLLYVGKLRSLFIDPVSLFGIVWGTAADAHKGPFATFMKGVFLITFSFLVTDPVIGISTKLASRLGNNMVTKAIGGALGIAFLEAMVHLGEYLTPYLEKFFGFSSPKAKGANMLKANAPD